MKKSYKEIIENATNDHDRKLMIKELDKFDRIYNKSITLMWIATFFTIVGIFGIQFNEYFILSFIPVFPLMLIVQLNMLKSSGLF